MLSEKIVLVDDDQRVHDSLKEILFEYQIISFQDSQKALEYLSKPNEVKLAIVDVCMKGLNGIELLERLKKAKEDMAVIIITAHSSQDIVVEALRLHADDFIEKPFEVEEIRNRIRKILKEKSKYDTASRDPKEKMQRIRQFIERNYTNASLEYIANEMCLSPLYLSRLFTKHNKEGFRDFKLKVRMEKAMELLKGTHLDVSEIAYQLGYENPESFMRAFKRFTKMTPGTYRAQNQTSRKKVK